MNWDVVWDQEPPLSADGSGTWETNRSSATNTIDIDAMQFLVRE
jgi:hypothetical protein